MLLSIYKVCRHTSMTLFVMFVILAAAATYLAIAYSERSDPDWEFPT